MSHEKLAMDLFMGGCNCAQSVLLAYKDELGVDEDTLIRLAAPFGGGCTGLREMCGAVSAMIMVMGLKSATTDYHDLEAKRALYKRGQALADAFERENGSRNCAELLNLAKDYRPDPSPRNAAYYKARPCIRLVSSAARLLDQALFPGDSQKDH